MKKYFLSMAIIVSFFLYALRGQLGKLGHEDEYVIPAPNLNTSTPTNQNTNVAAAPDTNASSSPSITNTASSAPPPTPVPVSNGQYKNGSSIGSVADAYYGNIQVKITVRGGKIADVQFLQYPNDRENSIVINQYAMPILRSEAIQVQSAKVDIVSGATDTSYAFQQSLQSALTRVSPS